MCDLTRCGARHSLPEVRVSDQTRREFIQGLVSLPLATVLAVPALSRAAAASTESISITTGNGRSVSAALAMPAADKAPAVLLIHEWWGLNDQIKTVAAEFANLGFIALAVDLYQGAVETKPDKARALMQAVNPGEATDTLVSWVDWLRRHPATNGKVGTVGWCFGGGWSLNASAATPVDATVVYYGRVDHEVATLGGLDGPVMGHFATRDGWITAKMVDGFEFAMADAGKDQGLSVHWYEADHGFANPTSARYDEEDAALAWERTVGFFRDHLG